MWIYIVFIVRAMTSLEIIQVNLNKNQPMLSNVGVLSLECLSSRPVNKSNHRFNFPFVEMLSLRIYLSRPDEIYYESQFNNMKYR
jgi:hypothetical protein